jgi:outer membrane protein OmpA-like peptidoglycan-associated protein
MNELGAEHGTAVGCTLGTVFGLVAGAAIGQKTGNKNAGLVIGGLTGAGLGCYLGNRWQKREKALQAFAKRENLNVKIESLSVGATAGQPSTLPPRGPSASSTNSTAAASQNAGLVANIQSSGMFDSDSDQFTTEGLRQARALADIYKPETSTNAGQPPESSALLIVGHTDATGTAVHNQELSERRARTMGRVLAEAGIDPSRVYFQGAGSGRPIADNTTDEGRALNRRVEITSLDTSDLLIQRIRQEQASPKYLAHGTSTTAIPPSPTGPTNAQRTVPPLAPRPPESAAVMPPDFVDFGGRPRNLDSNDLAAYVRPRQTGFSLINSAYAESSQIQDCQMDTPRIVGSVKNLATGQPLDAYETRDYFDGMNGRAWAGLVNGNLVTMTPVAILKDKATVVKNPQTFVTRGYSSGQRQPSDGFTSIANTYEGEHAILYRVFVKSEHAPLQCFDVVMPKDGSGVSPKGKLYYDRGGTVFVAPFVPQRS